MKYPPMKSWEVLEVVQTYKLLQANMTYNEINGYSYNQNVKVINLDIWKNPFIYIRNLFCKDKISLEPYYLTYEQQVNVNGIEHEEADKLLSLYDTIKEVESEEMEKSEKKMKKQTQVSKFGRA